MARTSRRAPRRPGERLHIEQRRDDGADVHDEHDGIAPLHSRIELAHGLHQRGSDEITVEQRQLTARHLRSQRPPGSMKCSTMGPSASAGTKVRTPMSSTEPISSATNSRSVRRHGALGHGHALFLRERSGDGEHGHDRPVAADPHHESEARCRTPCSPTSRCKRAAVVVARGCERIQDLAEAVSARIRDAGLARAREDGYRRADEHHEGRGEDRDGAQLHLERLDFLAEVLGRAADHQARDEHAEDGEHQDRVSPVPTPPNTTSPSCMRNSGTKPPSGVSESCMLN
jgi:hypothetical protein